MRPPLKAKTIEEALRRASFCLQSAGIEESRTEAEILLAHFVGQDRLQLFLNRFHELPSETDASFQDALQRRAHGEPLAYITGEKYFYGLKFNVNKSVLIPRPETEFIIEGALVWVLQQKSPQGEGICCIDLGTGSGVLAVTLAVLLSRASLWAVDISEAALQTAMANAERHGVRDRVRFFHGSYFQALIGSDPQPQFNLVLANPPYLNQYNMERLPLTVSQYEPFPALYGGEDGLDGYRALLDSLRQYIVSPGLVLLEVGALQAQEVQDLCRRSNLFRAITWRYDLSGWPRVMEGLV